MCKRCDWAGQDELMIAYHDREWGVPLWDDQRLFEFLILEIFQAGLSWAIVLRKRENFRKAFDDFNPEEVSKYSEQKLAELLGNASIIRNRSKINAAVHNAHCFLEVQREFGSFARYLWQFVDFEPIQNAYKHLSDLPAKTALSDRLAADLKKRGFKFVGSTVLYAFLQATGVVNDHLQGCFRYPEIKAMGVTIREQLGI